MMKVEVTCRETIKPSSPTSPHNKTFKLSLIDQLHPSIFMKFISYYAPTQTKQFQNLEQILKQSLSEALTVFYPFAGRISEDIGVDCNDNGVFFITTSVDCELVDLLASPRPKIESFDKLLPPLTPFFPDQSDKPSLVVFQLNEFRCGGIAISFCFNHLLIDAITMSTFLKCWSEIAAKVKSATDYSILPAVLMYTQGSEKPPNLSGTIENSLLRDGRGTIRRFVFEDWALLKIKENAKSEHVPNPSRVEALTGFIWKHMIEASEVVWGYKQPSVLCQPVDLRRRMQLGIMPNMLPVGNILWKAVVHYRKTTTAESDAKMEKELVSGVRESFDKIKDDFIPKLISKGAYDTIREYLEELHETLSDGNINPYKSTSWNKIGLKDTNFGWGKPIWVSFVGGSDVDSVENNFFFLIDGGVDSIEAWITLDKKEMEVIENSPEFLAFALPNPPVLIL